VRLDEILKKQGFSASEAQGLILAGRVRSRKSGQALDKAGADIKEESDIWVTPAPSFVGRGGDKLDTFLKNQDVRLSGAVVLDVGSSTGGFTDCVLQRGASRVISVDVGTHQLHEKLREDSRVRVFEQTDIRSFHWPSDEPPPSLVVVDVAFISLRLIVPHLRRLAPHAMWILLFKPQFEVERYIPKKRGVAPVVDADAALKDFLLWMQADVVYRVMSQPSAVKGSKGNQETFILVNPPFRSEVFRTYDIRGDAENDLSPLFYYRLGRAYAERLLENLSSGNHAVGVGRDARLSSPAFFEALVAGLSDGGLSVWDLGLTTTPMVYFAHYHFPLAGVVQITASHNPQQDNGAKMMMNKQTLFGDDIQDLCRRMNASDFIYHEQSRDRVQKEDLLKEAYRTALLSQFSFSKKYKLAVDCGNGMAGVMARQLFEPYADTLDILYEEVDCTFPHHEADPTVEKNLRDIVTAVKSKDYDFGFAYDGDADRLGVITPKGRILWGDEILMLLAELVLKERPGATVIGEVKCSEKLFAMIRSRGGDAVMYRTGHSLIKKKMKELKAPLAGEMSGHLFFADRYFGFDDALYASLRVIEVVDRLGLNLDDWIDSFPPTFVTPELRVTCAESEKSAAVTQIIQFLKKDPALNLTEIDGVRATWPDGSWALIRASNTQAVLVVRVEAPSKERQKEIITLVEEGLGRKIGHV
jgi:phosphomannomutase/phosphoglucomutase